jgi:hypothetical protein
VVSNTAWRRCALLQVLWRHVTRAGGQLIAPGVAPCRPVPVPVFSTSCQCQSCVDQLCFRPAASCQSCRPAVDGAMSTQLATRRDEVLWRGTGIPQSPAAKEDLRGYLGNGHIQRSFQYAVGVTDITVDLHRSYRCSQLLPLPGNVDIHGLTSMEHVALISPSPGYSVRDVI